MVFFALHYLGCCHHASLKLIIRGMEYVQWFDFTCGIVTMLLLLSAKVKWHLPPTSAKQIGTSVVLVATDMCICSIGASVSYNIVLLLLLLDMPRMLHLFLHEPDVPFARIVGGVGKGGCTQVRVSLLCILSKIFHI